MQPRSLFADLGHGSLVIPMSDFGPLEPFSVLSPPRHPASEPTVSTAARANMPNLFIEELLTTRSVRERPGFPVVAEPDPDAEQPAWLEDQEHDDQHAVEDGLELVGVRGLRR